MPEKKACFVIGPIGEENTPARNNADTLLRYVIKAGLEEKYKVTRADEISTPGMINDQVITHIQRADLIVADLHGENPNAYYEVAIAHCFRRRTIHMIAKGAKIPFDLHEYRAIHYDLANPDAHDQARQELERHANALEAADVVISNPVTRALGTFQLEQTGDTRDRIVVELSLTMQRVMSEFSTFLDRFTDVADVLLKAGIVPPPPPRNMLKALAEGRLTHTLLGGAFEPPFPPPEPTGEKKPG